MEKEYIDREALKNRIHCTKEGLFFTNFKTYIDFDVVRKAVLETPVADVEEVRHGRWIETRRVQKSPEGYYYWNTSLTRVYVCSECGRHEDKKEPYCNCGAKMDG